LRGSPGGTSIATTGGQSNHPGQSHQNGQPTNTPAPAQPTNTPAPPAAGAMLYSADWSGGMAGWGGPAQWGASSGELVASGDNQNYLDVDHTTAIAPFHPAYADYAVASRIRLITCGTTPPGCYGGFGLALRLGQNPDTGWIFGVDVTGEGPPYAAKAEVYPAEKLGGSTYCGVYCSVAYTPYTPGTDWHTYRAEVRGNHVKLLIDGYTVVDATDNRFLAPGAVGLVAFGAQIEVSSFQVTAL
jgi:hypothetical protein